MYELQLIELLFALIYFTLYVVAMWWIITRISEDNDEL